MKTVVGDLIQLAIDQKFDVIIHGCNCFHTMGSGIAKNIKRLFPMAFYADKRTDYGSKQKLGSFSSAFDERYDLFIVNAYTQFGLGEGLQVDYEAVRNVFKKIKKQFFGKRIGYPKIGAGLAGGDWSIISKIIDEELEGEEHTLVVLPTAGE